LSAPSDSQTPIFLNYKEFMDFEDFTSFYAYVFKNKNKHKIGNYFVSEIQKNITHLVV
jgi:hypothetical protein